MAHQQPAHDSQAAVARPEYTRDLARFVVEHTFEAIPKACVDRAKLVLLDTLGCMVYGRTTVPGGIAADIAADFGGGHGVTLMGDKRRAPAPAAALANGVMAHSFELDDRNTETMSHPSGSVLPAAMALGERDHISGAKLLLAFVMGHEVTSHVAQPVVPESYVFGWHAQGWHPTLGAAASAGVVLGLNLIQMQHAFGLAGTQASGMIESAFSSNGKPFHSGKSAQAGVWSAVLAQRGFTGGLHALEGSARARGYCDLLSPNPKWDTILKGLGTEYKLVTRSGLKPYSCAGDMHCGIDAVLALKKRHNLKPEDIQAIHVHSFRIIPTHFNIPQPKATIDGLMSYQHCLAAALIYDKVTPAQFTAEMFADAKMQAIRSKITLDVDPELDAMFPKVYTARVDIVTARGTFTETVLASKGDPGNPMNQQEVEAKFVDLAAYLLPKDRVHRVLDLVRKIEDVKDMCEITDMLRPS